MTRIIAYIAALVLGAINQTAPGQTTVSASSNVKQPIPAPNIIVIFADDLGYGDLSCYGQTRYKTPHLDKMAEEGVRLTEFYVSAPACSPSRASLLTGQYPMRAGVPLVLFPRETTGLNPGSPKLPEVLKEEGYATAAIGKWHLGHLPRFMPTRNGFDYFFGLPYSNDMDPSPLMRDLQIVETPAEQDTLTRRYTEEAIKFIDQSAEKKQPFFLYFPHTFPHIPLHVSEKFKGSSGAGLYGDVITEIDWSVGELIRHLREKKLANNTLVVFSSDNGPWMIKGENGGTAGHLRGEKGMVYEGGIRVPFIAWWPDKLPAGKVIDEPACTVDMLPTLAKLAGASLPTGATYDGKDVWPVLAQGKSVGERTFVYPDFPVRDPAGAIRKGDWKLLVAHKDHRMEDRRTTELFNLKSDPSEKMNLADKHPEIVAELAAEAAEIRRDLEAANPWKGLIGKRSDEGFKLVGPPVKIKKQKQK